MKVVEGTIKLEDGKVFSFQRDTMLEAVKHAEEVFYPMGAVFMDFRYVDKVEGGDG